MDVPSNAMYFIWQGKASKDYGLVMTSVPSIIFPQKRITEAYMPNAPVPFQIDEGCEPFDLSFSVAYVNTADDIARIRENLQMFLNTCAIPFTRNLLIFSNDLTHCYKADIIAQIDWQAFYQYRTATLSFHCRPYVGMTNYTTGMTPSQISEYYTTVDNVVVKTNSVWREDATKNTFSVNCDAQVRYNRNPRVELVYKNGKQLGNASYITLTLYQVLGVYQYTYPNLRICNARNIMIDLTTVLQQFSVNQTDIFFSLDFQNNSYQAYRYIVATNSYEFIDIGKAINTNTSLAIVPKDGLLISNQAGLVQIIDNVTYNPGYLLTFGRIDPGTEGSYDVVCDIGILSTTNAWVGDNQTFSLSYFPRVSI